MIIEYFHLFSFWLYREKTWSDWNYIEVKADSDGCWSNVGMKGGKQDLNLQPNGCMYCRYYYF